MPRTIPSTGWNQEPEVTTSWDLEREVGFLLKEDLGFLLLESGGKIVLEDSTYSIMESDRYDEYVYLNGGEKLLNNLGEVILFHGIEESNVITTGWI